MQRPSDYNITFVPGTLTVVKSQTISTFTGPVIRAAVAPPVVFVVKVNAAGASSVPLTGVVRFYDGTRVIGDAAVGERDGHPVNLRPGEG